DADIPCGDILGRCRLAKVGAPATPAEPSTIIRGAARTIGLNVNMLHLAGWRDRPTRNGVEMIYRPAAALGDLLRTRRLDVAFVVDGAALQRGAAAVPLPSNPEPRERLW